MGIPELVGHRGYPRHYPENTLASFAAAIEAGARYVETDVQLTADEVPVLFHDRSLKRLCGVDGAIHDYSLESLARFHASDFDRFGYRFAQEPIPTLAQFAALLAAHSGVTAFVEIKRAAVERFGVGTVLNRVLPVLEPVTSRSVLISYSLETLAAARGRGAAAVGVVIDRWREGRQPIMQEIRPEYLFCDVHGLPWFGPIRFNHAKIAVYEVTDPRRALELARRGVTLVETFAIGEMRAGIELLAAAS